jgi:hypothetical protein
MQRTKVAGQAAESRRWGSPISLSYQLAKHSEHTQKDTAFKRPQTEAGNNLEHSITPQ